ncbi:MAG: fatty acid desaturase [Saprospiraceae bacterium]
MKTAKTNSATRTVRLTLGGEELTYRPEYKKSLDIEIMLLHVPLFAVVFAYAQGYIVWPLFYLLFHIFEMRIFIGNHDRFHTDMSVRLPRVIEAISEWVAVCVTPWDEPYESIKKKHITHHITHSAGESAPHDVANDPHLLYESGGPVRAFLNCLFFEEVQLIHDIRYGNLTKDRLFRFLIYAPLIALFILNFGWAKFWGVFAAMRIVGATGWFVFSWGIHQPAVYRFGFSKKVPRLFKFLFQLMNGRRVTEGCIHHVIHHAWPGVPYTRLREFDAAVLRHPEAAPDMRPAGS